MAALSNRLSASDAVALLESNDLPEIAEAADNVCKILHPEDFRTYNIERNINYTNCCVSGCKFCAFYRSHGNREVYVIDRESLFSKISEIVAIGGNQILLQGGLHPSLPFEWYLDTIRSIKKNFPQVNVHGFSPTEISFFSDKFSLPIEEVLYRLREAGLGSLPGGGAEILVDRVRNALSPNKASAKQWLEVCRIWHKMGGRGSATMMFGHVETLEERVEHLLKLRELQDETGGFTAFICWTFQPKNTALSNTASLFGSTDKTGISGTSDISGKAGSWQYLKTLAVSRLFLDNFSNIQASCVTQGMRIGPLALRFGANDLGSVMIEENVVAAAGTVYRTNEEQICDAIREAGFVPRKRDVFYAV